MKKLQFTMIALTLVAVMGVAGTASATTCVKGGFICTATVDLIEWNGTPTIPCLNTDIVVRVTTNVSCLGGGSAGPIVEYRCGTDNESIVFSGAGYTHKLGVRKNWADVEAGSCGNLGYKHSL